MELMTPAVPLLPWLAALWIAVRVVSRRGQDIPDPTTLPASLLANGSAFLLLLYLSGQASLETIPVELPLGVWFASGDVALWIRFRLDALGLSLGILFSLVALLTLRFSANYMQREAGRERFFMVLNLFAGALSLLLLAGSALMAFVAWEILGVSSFLLIGFARERPTATANANHAFITNRLGDAGFLLGIFLSFRYFGGSEWVRFHTLPDALGSLGVGAIGIAFLLAALAKSAQVPFSPWISRALDGPTPSSAIFYGALMVHAGVFLLLRLAPLLRHTPDLLTFIAVLGLVTVLYGWLSGLQASDVKSALTFSVISQVGLMFFWCGNGWFTLAAWHLGLHVCWRIHQFLRAPSFLAQVSQKARPVPAWLARSHRLHAAAMHRFWLEQMGRGFLVTPVARFAADALNLEKRVINPLAGLPNPTGTIASPAHWEELQENALEFPDGGIGRGQGLAGKLIQQVATVCHLFEERLVLHGAGAGLLSTVRRLGKHLMRLELLLAQPRYLVLLILLTFILIL